MSDFNRGLGYAAPAAPADMAVDAGLRGFMLGVYNKVALGLVLSAIMAGVTAYVEPVRNLLFRIQEIGGVDRLVGVTPLYWVVALAPIGIILFGGMALRNPSPRASGMIYWSVVALLGASLGTLAFRYTGESLASTFLITAAAFGALSLFGYTTKRDLTPIGSFLIIGVFGLILAGVVNIFLQSPMMSFVISAAGVLIFAGLIAYDTQRLKMTYYELGGNEAGMAVATNYGALSLYLDFINLFQFLLMIFGGRR